MEAVAGRRPLGFRAPGYTAGPRLLTELSRAGLRYDGSVLPTRAAPLLRFLANRLRAQIRRELGKKQIVASDRRYRQALSLLQAHAYLMGEDAVTEKDLFFLEHVLWRDPSEQQEVRATIRELLLGYEEEVKELLYQSQEIRDYALRPWETSEMRAQALIEVHTKLRNILAKIDQIMEKAKQLGRPLDKAGAIREEIEGIQRQMLERF